VQHLAEKVQRNTATDIVFDQLYSEIASLELLPQTKLSEAEIARRFGVSRQPVRDAFNRLENLDLLLIRPQKATEVRGFSLQRIAQARFVRLAVELEVVRHACSIWDDTRAEALDENLQQQRQFVADKQPEQFHALDFQFHKMICEIGGGTLAIETIEMSKLKVDRLCALSLGRENEFSLLLDDHVQLAQALKNRSADEAVAIVRRHLARLDDTINDIHDAHSEYFE